MHSQTALELQLMDLVRRRNKRENELLLEMARMGWNQYFHDIIKDNWQTDEEVLSI